MKLSIELIPAYVSLTRPDASKEEHQRYVSKLTLALENKQRDPDLIRLQLDKSGQLTAAIGLFAHSEHEYELGKLRLASDLTDAQRVEATGLIDEAIEVAQRRGLRKVGTRIEVASQFPAYKAALLRNGFRHSGGRIEFKRPVAELPDDDQSPLSWQSMAERSQREAGDLLARVGEDAPDWEPDEDPHEVLAAYFEDPLLTKGPDCVHFGRLDGHDVALVVAQIDERDGWSRITYMGLVKEARGQGLGAWVHKHGFTMLKAQGGKLYHGGTSTDNPGMLKLFERHGCERFRELEEWLWRPSKRDGG